MSHYDILVIGSGPAGQYAAIQAAKCGKNVALVERKPKIGGAGLQTGTIPSKALREIAYSTTVGTSHGMRNIHPNMTRQHNFLAESIRRKDLIIDKQESVFLNQLMRNGITLIPGEAGFHDHHTLNIKTPRGEQKKIQADKIILATGSRPRRPDDVPFDKERILDSTSILKMQQLPKSMTIVGGGVIACEFATIYASLGVQVTIVDSHAQILAFLCHDIAGNLRQAMQNLGIQFLMGQHIGSIEKQGKQVTLSTQESSITSDCLLYALGRVPNIEGLNLEDQGISSHQRGWIQVNEHYQTNIPHVYAVGDLIGAPALAATGMEQGRIASQHACNNINHRKPSHLPMAIYTIPEIAWVGKTSTQLDKDGQPYITGFGHYRETGRGQIIGDNNGMLKLLINPENRQILGVHIVGELASELVHIGQMVMNLNGDVDDLIRHVFNYPTLAECYKTAALHCSNQLKEQQQKNNETSTHKSVGLQECT